MTFQLDKEACVRERRGGACVFPRRAKRGKPKDGALEGLVQPGQEINYALINYIEPLKWFITGVIDLISPLTAVGYRGYPSGFWAADGALRLESPGSSHRIGSRIDCHCLSLPRVPRRQIEPLAVVTQSFHVLNLQSL